MGKTKTRRKAPAQQEQGAFNRFLNDMYLTFTSLDEQSAWEDFNNATMTIKRKVYDRVIQIQNPKAGNELITPSELNEINLKIKQYYRERTLKVDSALLSNYQLQLIMSYWYVLAEDIERKTGIEDCDNAVEYKNTATKLTEVVLRRFFTDCCRVVTQMSNPAKKHYSINIRSDNMYLVNRRINLIIEIFGTAVKKSMVEINGVWRPIYQMGKTNFHHNVEWIIVPSHLLKDHYLGHKDTLEVFIQAHALSRLKERLDTLDEEALNYALWENTKEITGFTSYKGYLLLPFKLFDIRIGYLVANIMDDKIVFRTFLFITHNCTPEGDKLRRITGLSKHDISYWKIDRLSTFINLDLNKNADLVGLLNNAGMSDLWQLKEKTFHIDDLQIANLDGLMEYIKKGKMEILEPV